MEKMEKGKHKEEKWKKHGSFMMEIWQNTEGMHVTVLTFSKTMVKFHDVSCLLSSLE